MEAPSVGNFGKFAVILFSDDNYFLVLDVNLVLEFVCDARFIEN